jgi:hypothetical protein
MSLYMVEYNDDDLHIPMTWDPDCAGALCCVGADNEPVATFATRADARSAIRVSTCFATLCRAQGKPYNVDFLTHLKNIRIRRLDAPRAAS